METSFGYSFDLDDVMLDAVNEVENHYLKGQTISATSGVGNKSVCGKEDENGINYSQIKNESFTIHGRKPQQPSQENKARLEGQLNISNISSPVCMSTPTEASVKSHRKRLSKSRTNPTGSNSTGNSNRKSTPKISINAVPLKLKTKNEVHVVTKRNGSIGKELAATVSPSGKRNQTQSKFTFQNLLGCVGDSDSDSCDEKVKNEPTTNNHGSRPTHEPQSHQKENQRQLIKSLKSSCLGKENTATTENHVRQKEIETNKQSSGISNTASKVINEDVPAAGNEGETSKGTIKVDDQYDRLALSSWGLPEAVLQRYHDNKITRMFEWQAECLCTGNVLAGGNLVYSAPTSAGKTMVAELLILKQVVETKRKAIFIFPFISVSKEKMVNLQDLWQDAGVRVQGYMGQLSGGFQSLDVAVCTIEKANSLVNRLMEEGQLNQLGIVVVDELHMIGDSSRGYLLELLLTKIQYVTSKAVNPQQNNSVQIVGMSATLPNVDLLARWLKADLYHTDYRPVPLSETVKIGNSIYDNQMRKIRDIDSAKVLQGDEDNIAQLCLETIHEGCSVLIFCPTKQWCEKLAINIAKLFYRLCNAAPPQDGTGFVKASELLPSKLDKKSLDDVIEQLSRTPAGMDSTLRKCVPFACAYHHAGLTFDERDIVEGAFRLGHLKVLVATSTLSSGVNLPSKRVIIRSPGLGGRTMGTLTYKQMVGRAGRKGVDTSGESILICKPNERTKATTLVKSTLPPVHSCLSLGDGKSLSSSLKRAVLEVVVSGVATTPDEVATYAGCTLLATECAEASGGTTDQHSAVTAAIQFLGESEFITLKRVKDADGKEVERYFPSQLGAAVLASALPPDEGLTVFSELQKARKNFVLENELHIVYQVTPIYMQIENLDWYKYMHMWENLSPDMRKVSELVGVQEGFLARAINGRIPTKTPAQIRLHNIHKRFYTAMVLHDLVQEMPLLEVAHKYDYNKGSLQTLQQQAATFAGMVTVFCAKLGWTNMELLLSQFHNRLTFGVQRELIDLVRISLLNGQRARVLYNAGYQTVAALANADYVAIEQLLRNAVPFDSKKKADGETEWEAAERRKMRCIWLTGKKGLTEQEAAVQVIEEARKLVQEDLGMSGIEWDQANKTSNENSSEKQTSILLKSCEPKTSLTYKKRLSIGWSSFKSPPPNQRVSKSPATQKQRTQSPGQGAKEEASQSILSPPPSMRKSMLEGPKFKSPLPTFRGQGEQVTPRRSKSGSKTGSGRKRRKSQSPAQKAASRSPAPSRNKSKASPSCSKSNAVPKEETDGNNKNVIINKAFMPKHNSSKTKIVRIRTSPRIKGNSIRDKSSPSGQNAKTYDRESLASPNLYSEPVPLDKSPIVQMKNTEAESQGLDDANIFSDSFVVDSQSAQLADGAMEVNAPRNYGQLDREVNGMGISCLEKGKDTSADNSSQILYLGMQEPDSNLEDPSRALCESVNVSAKSYKRNSCVGKTETGRGFSSKSGSAVAKATTSTHQNGGGPAMEIDLSQDGAVDQYMQDYCTQNIVAQTASPVLARRNQENRDNLNNPSKSKSYSDSQSLLSTTEDDLNEAVEITDTSIVNTSNKEGGQRQLPISFTDSPELVASNYERLGTSADGGLFDEDNDQNHERGNDAEMRVPFQPALITGTESKDTQTMPPPKTTGLPGKIKRGSFKPSIIKDTSEKGDSSSTSVAQPLVNKNIEVSMDMDDSFTSSMASQALAMATGKIKSPAPKSPRKRLYSDELNPIPSEMNDSLTFSMMTKALDNEKVIKANGVKNGHKTLTVTKSKRDKVSSEPSKDNDCEPVGDLSQETIELMQQICGDTPVKKAKPAPKKSVKRKSNPDSHEKSIESKQRKTTPKRRHNWCDQEESVVTSPQNDSAASDYVPPTPPDPNRTTSTKTPNKSALTSRTESPAVILKKTKTKQSKSNEDDLSQDNLDNGIVEDSSPPIPMTYQSFSITDTAANRVLFEHFISEWRRQDTYALCLACEKIPPQPPDPGGIGANFNKVNKIAASRTKDEIDGFLIEGTDCRVVGLAVSWANRDSYYIALTKANLQDELEDSLLPASLDESLGIDEKLSAIKSVVEQPCIRSRRGRNQAAQSTKVVFDLKAQYKLFSQVLGVQPGGPWQDPKVAAWLTDPGVSEANLHRLVHNWVPLEVPLLEGLGGGVGVGSVGLNPENPGSGRVRACTEVVLVNHLQRNLMDEMRKKQLLVAFTEIEMLTIVLLANMELNGFGFSDKECESQKAVMQAKLSAIEEEAYHLAGHPFSLTSTEDISQVLYQELRLPPSGDPSVSTVTKTLGPARRVPAGRGRGKPQYSTSKDILEKLKKHHRLPGLILEWRRINNSLSKVVFPLQKEKQLHPALDMYRIYGVCQTYTATGRVTMSEPNLQNIPKNFDIQMPGIIGESPPTGIVAPGRYGNERGYNRYGNNRPAMATSRYCSNATNGPSVAVSMRHAFVPFNDGILVAADYSQLELRLIAHLSQDSKLISILNQEGDVFRTIAAQWKGLEESEITSEQRQQVKQICYGMLYGIGAKALGEQLGVDENEASVFMETFKAKYTGMRRYLQACVTKCREHGYVETITSRRRYLPAIRDKNTYARAHAERQAVNTTVQGSAADLVKKAMVLIDERIQRTFTTARPSHRHKVTQKSDEGRRKSRRLAGDTHTPSGAYLVLQLHDELIYEVPEKDKKAVALIIKQCMESAMTLSVKLPVKVKAGESWGTLRDLDVG